MHERKDLALANAPELDKVEVLLKHIRVADMTQLAAEALRYRADADVRIADKTYAEPARQETLRTVIVVAGLIGGVVLLNYVGAPKDTIVTIVVTLGAVFGVPAAVGKWRKER